MWTNETGGPGTGIVNRSDMGCPGAAGTCWKVAYAAYNTCKGYEGVRCNSSENWVHHRVEVSNVVPRNAAAAERIVYT